MFGAASTPTPKVAAIVAAGGAIGASGRWAVGELVPVEPGAWPWATLLVNVAGALVIGAAARRLHLDSIAWAFVVTGVLGGFTTFSALAIELNDLVDAERLGAAIAYGAVTLGAGIGATLLGSTRAGAAP